MLETQQFFYDTQVPGTDFFGPSFWKNLRDGLTGGPWFYASQYEIKGFQVVAPTDIPVGALVELVKGKILLSLPINACLHEKPGAFRLSGVEMQEVSAKIEGASGVNIPVTLIIETGEGG